MAEFADFLVRIGVQIDTAGVRRAVSEAISNVQRLEQQLARGVPGVNALGQFGQSAGFTREQLRALPGRIEEAGGRVTPRQREAIAAAERRVEQMMVRAAYRFEGLQRLSGPERFNEAMRRLSDAAIRGEGRFRGAVDLAARAASREAASADKRARESGRPFSTDADARAQRRLEANRAKEEEYRRERQDPEHIAARTAALDSEAEAKQLQGIEKLESRNRALAKLLGDEELQGRYSRQTLGRMSEMDRLVQARTDANRLAAQRSRVLAGDEGNVRAAAERQLAQERERRAVRASYLEQRQPSDTFGEARNQALEEQETQQRRYFLEQFRAADEGRLARMRRTTELESRRAVEEERATALGRAGAFGLTVGEGESTAAVVGRVAAMDRARTLEERAALNRAMLANEHGELDAIVAERRSQTQLNQAVNARLRMSWRDIRNLPADQRGSLIQQFQAYLHMRQGGTMRMPTEFGQGRQLLGSGALTTARFAATGAVLYGGIQGIRTMVEDASKLEVQMSQVRAELDALGDSRHYSAISQGILSIARDTGIATSEIADLTIQLRGAYQLDPRTGRDRTGAQATQLALLNTRAGAEISKVTGLPLKEVTDSLTAAALAYDATFTEIGDKALGLQDRFGVLARESIKFFGDMAAVAKQYGFSLEELGAIEGVAQQAAGKSGAALAEGLNRVVPNVEKNAAEIARAYMTIPGLQANAGKVMQDLGGGQYGKVMVQLIRDWGSLSDSQRAYFITLMGGSRQAQDIIPIFQNYRKVVGEIDRAESDAGRTHRSYAEISGTLSQQLARLRQEFGEIGVALYDAGLGDVLKDIALFAGGAAAALRVLATGFAFVNERSHSLVIRLAEVVLLLKGLQAVQTAFRASAAARAVEGVVEGAVATSGAGAAGVEAAAARRGLLGRFGPSALATAAGSRFGGLRGRVAARYADSLQEQRLAQGVGVIGAVEGTGTYGRYAGTYTEATSKGSAALAAIGLTRLNLTVAAAVIVAQHYRKVQGDVGDAAEQLRKQLAEAPLDKLQEEYTRLGRESLVERAKQRAAEVLHISPGTPRDLVGEQLDLRAGGDLGSRLRAIRRTGLLQDRVRDVLAPADAGAVQAEIGEDPGWAEFLEAVERGSHASVAAARQLVKSTTLTPRQRAQVARALGDVNDAKQKAAQDAQDALTTLEEATANYQRGDTSYDDYIRVLRQTIRVQHELRSTSSDPEKAKEAAQAEGQAQDALSQLIISRQQGLVAIRQAFGRLRPQDSAIAAARAINLGNLNQDLTVQQGGALLQALEGQRTYAMENARSAAEAYADALRAVVPSPEETRALNTFIAAQARALNIPESVVRAEVEAGLARENALELERRRRAAAEEARDYDVSQVGLQIAQTRDPLAQARLRRDQSRRGLAFAESERDVRAAEAQGKLPGAQAEVASYENAVATNERLMADAGRSGQEVAAASANLARAREGLAAARQNVAALQDQAAGHSRELVDAQAAAADAEAAYADAIQAGIQSRFTLAANRARRRHDPVAAINQEANAARQALRDARSRGLGEQAENDAQDRIEQANADRVDYINSVADARRQRRQAQTRDPVVQAQIELEQANAELARAGRDEAAKEQALAHQAQAQQQLSDALNDVVSARQELAMAILERTGSPVEIAQRQLQNAQDALAKAKAQGAGDAAITRAQADVERQQTALGDARLASALELIQFDLDMDKITRGEAIARLRMAFSMADSEAERRDIMRRIHDLEKSTSDSMAFNLPSDIKLPSMYEVRRARGALESGGGYNDNRVVQVYMTNNNATDYQGSIDRFTELLNAPSRFAPGGRAY